MMKVFYLITGIFYWKTKVFDIGDFDGHNNFVLNSNSRVIALFGCGWF
jgi:hypothetical protein